MPPPDDYDDDKDMPLEEDLDGGSSDLAEMTCPSCGGIVTEDTQKCPHCNDWIIPQDTSQRGWRRWIYVMAVLLMLYAIWRWTI